MGEHCMGEHRMGECSGSKLVPPPVSTTMEGLPDGRSRPLVPEVTTTSGIDPRSPHCET